MIYSFRFLISISIIVVGVWTQVQAQELMKDNIGNSGTAFPLYQKHIDEWRSNSGSEGKKGSKWLQRWSHFMESRTNAGGELAPNKDYLNAAVSVADQKNHSSGSRASDSTWYPLGPDTLVPGRVWYSSHGVARVNCIEFHPTDPNTYWVGVSQGGIWKTTNSGQSYTPINNNLPILRISDIEVDPNHPDTIYISVGDYAYLSVALSTDGRKRNTHYGLGVYKSVDGGKTWNPTGLTYNQTDFDNSLVKRVFVNPSNSQELVAAGITGVWKSYDAGANWTKKLDKVMWDLEMNPQNHKSLLASSGWILNLGIGEAQIWKSTDFGENWTATQNTIPLKDSVQRIDLAIADLDTNYCYALSCGRDRGLYSFYQSTDGGSNWISKTNKTPNVLDWGEGTNTGGQGTYDLCMIVDQNDVSKVFTGGINIWGTPDGGSTWDGVSYWLRYYGFTPHADQHFMAYNKLDKKYYVCNDGGIFRTDTIHIGSWDSTNTGGYQFPTNWEDVSSGMQITSFYRVGISENDEKALVSGAQDNGTFFTSKSKEWTNISGGDGMDCMIDRNDANNLVTTSQYGNFYWSNNGGRNVRYLGDLSLNENAAWTTPVIQLPGDDFEVLAGYENLYYWSPMTSEYLYSSIPSSNDNPIVDIAIGKTVDDMAVVKRPNFLDNENSEIWVTNNRGTKWTNRSAGLPDSLFFTSVIIDDRDSGMMWVSIGGFENGQKVFRSSDAGANWSNISRNLPNIPINILVQDRQALNNAVYAGTDIGVYYTNDSLNSWILYSKELPNVIVSDLQIHKGSRKLVASTFGRGLWNSSLIDTIHIWPEDTMKKPDPKDTNDPKDPVVILEQNKTNDSYWIFPNPSNGQVQLEYSRSTKGPVKFDLIDVMGQVVWRDQFELNNGEGQRILQFNVLPGNYYLRINDGPKPQVVRIVIE